MMRYDLTKTYNQTTAMGATAIGQIVALYDAILRDLHEAWAGAAQGDVERRVSASNHALMIIGELQGVIDFDQGAEAARNLSNFYSVARGMILQASMLNSQEKFREVAGLVARLRSAWKQIEPELPAMQPKREVRIASEPIAVIAESPARVAEYPEMARQSGWTA